MLLSPTFSLTNFANVNIHKAQKATLSPFWGVLAKKASAMHMILYL
jgi:hypothetical protein